MKKYTNHIRFIFLLSIASIILCSCNKKISINQEVSDQYLLVDDQLTAFNVNADLKEQKYTDFSAVIDKMNKNSDIIIFKIAKSNEELSKITARIDYNAKTISGEFNERQNYLAINRNISPENKDRYGLLYALKNIPGLTIPSNICHYILCAPDIFQLNDVIEKYDMIGNYRNEIPSKYKKIHFRPSVSQLSGGNACEGCFKDDPILINPGKIYDLTPNIEIDPCKCVPESNLSDFKILKKIHDLNPNNNLNWDFNNTSMIGWKGVVIINGKVRSLSLREANIDTIPPEIGFLCNLITLDLYSNEIAHIPIEIGMLFKLEQLSFNTNKISSLPKEIGQLKNLEELLLNENRLISIPDEIGNLKALQLLNLAYNNLINIPESIGSLNDLTYFNLFGNKLSSIPRSLGNLNNLKILTLMENPTRSIPQIVCNLDDSDTRVRLDDGSNPSYPKDICE